MRTRKVTAVAVATVCLAMVLTACGTPDDEPDAEATTPAASLTTRDTTVQPTETETVTEPATTNTTQATGDPTESEEDVTSELDPEVFNTEQQNSQSWPGAVRSGGEPIPIDGAASLAVRVGGVSPDPDDPTAANEVEPWTNQRAEGAGIVEVLPDAPFEGHAAYYIGLDEERGFDVHTAEDPGRVIVDIAH